MSGLTNLIITFQIWSIISFSLDQKVLKLASCAIIIFIPLKMWQSYIVKKHINLLPMWQAFKILIANCFPQNIIMIIHLRFLVPYKKINLGVLTFLSIFLSYILQSCWLLYIIYFEPGYLLLVVSLLIIIIVMHLLING